MSQLSGVTYHMGSHSVTYHPTQVNTPRLNASQTDRYLIYLPRRDGRLSWPKVSECANSLLYTVTAQTKYEKAQTRQVQSLSECIGRVGEDQHHAKLQRWRFTQINKLEQVHNVKYNITSPMTNLSQ